MKRYRVSVPLEGVAVVLVNAESSEAAEQIAVETVEPRHFTEVVPAHGEEVVVEVEE